MAVAPLFRLTSSANPKLKIKKIWTSYDALRVGSSFEMKLHLRVNRCRFPLEVKGEPALRRIGFEVVPQSGIQVRFVGRNFDKIDCSPSGAEWTTQDLVLTLGVAATPEFSPGMHELSALLSCDVTRREGESMLQQFSVAIPLKVVPAHELVKKKKQVGARIPWRVLLSPVRLVDSILFWDR
ncbi:MAG TPA: hypothetical protein VG759_10465 [Candidatus Angelobacter sp.]|jgi:hypothetical protein|nr:hypothetical protein [Candidatus Angelobacter sp.]